MIKFNSKTVCIQKFDLKMGSWQFCDFAITLGLSKKKQQIVKL